MAKKQTEKKKNFEKDALLLQIKMAKSDIVSAQIQVDFAKLQLYKLFEQARIL